MKTPSAIWKAYQVSAKKIHYRQAHTPEDRTIVAMYEALEEGAAALRALSLQVALLKTQEPTAAAASEYAHLLNRLNNK